MSKIKDTNFFDTFPQALKQDEKLATLGKVIANELHILVEESEKNIIYANIDNLSETWLDVLAYDLHVDWYNYDYPIDVKRNLIKNSVKVHQTMGTKYAIETALESIYLGSRVEEWWEYNGDPYMFKIIVNITQAKIPMSRNTIFDIYKTVEIYKRLTAHLESIEVLYKTSIKNKNVCCAKLGNIIQIKAKPTKDLILLSSNKIFTVQKIGTTISLRTKEA